jgi:hypothetical protein
MATIQRTAFFLPVAALDFGPALTKFRFPEAPSFQRQQPW